MTARDLAVKEAKETIIKWNPYMAQVMPELVRVIAEALEARLLRIEELEKTEKAIMDLSHPNIKLYRDENQSLKESLKEAVDSLVDIKFLMPDMNKGEIKEKLINAIATIKSKFPDLFEKEKP